MLVAGDLSGLEWQVAAFLSQDKVMLEELWSGRDPHLATGEEHFKWEGERAHWKIFNFRMIF